MTLGWGTDDDDALDSELANLACSENAPSSSAEPSAKHKRLSLKLPKKALSESRNRSRFAAPIGEQGLVMLLSQSPVHDSTLDTSAVLYEFSYSTLDTSAVLYEFSYSTLDTSTVLYYEKYNTVSAFDPPT